MIYRQYQLRHFQNDRRKLFPIVYCSKPLEDPKQILIQVAVSGKVTLILVTDVDNRQHCDSATVISNVTKIIGFKFLPCVVAQLGFREVLLLEMNPVLCMRSEMVLISHWSVHHFGFLFEVYLLLVEFLVLLLVRSSR